MSGGRGRRSRSAAPRLQAGDAGTTGDFRHRAACRDVDPELFFPVGDSGPAQVQTAEAKAVCHTCDVTLRCLEWALRTGQAEGVLGGLDPAERRRLRSQRRGARSGTRVADAMSCSGQ